MSDGTRTWETVAEKGGYLYQIAARGDGVRYEMRRIGKTGKGRTSYGVAQSRLSAENQMKRKAGASVTML